MTVPHRHLIREAIHTEWHRRIAEQIADTPDGHVEAFTNVVMASLAEREDDDLTAWARHEQKHLWTDLDDAIRAAYNGAWSMQCANLACRIVFVARLDGPTPPDKIPWSLLAGGVYAAILTAAGITPDLPDEQQWQDYDAVMAHHGTRSAHQARYAETITAINTDRDWIAGDDEP